jgi:hypothetical protein
MEKKMKEDKQLNGITYKSMALITFGVVLGIVGTLNLQARPQSSFETAALHLQAPFEVDSVEPANWSE